MTRTALALTLLFATTLAAQDLSNFEKILLPGFTRGPLNGADGTIFSGGARAVSPVRAQYWPNQEGAIGTLDPVTVIFPPGTSRAGRVLFVERAFANQVSLDTTLFIRKPNEVLTAFTLMPVIRERDLLTGLSRIINIPSYYEFVPLEGGANLAVPRFRHHLRIYDVDGNTASQVRVRIIDQDVNHEISSSVVTLDLRDGNDASFPAYAEIIVDDVCHPFSTHSPCTGGAQYIEIESLTPGLRYWAMVSTTDNVTRDVDIHRPQ